MTSGSEDIHVIAEATARIFADLADPQTINASHDTAWAAPLWGALEETGLPHAWLPEDVGGAGLPVSFGFEIMRISGQYGALVPLAETLVAAWMLNAAGLAVPAGQIAVAPMRGLDGLTRFGGSLSGTAHSVAYSAVAHIVIVAESHVMLFAADQIQSVPRPTDMGAARVDITCQGATPLASAVLDNARELLLRMGATARACQMTGALETILALTTQYTQDREAFGRKIAKFQAVQQNCAVLAGEVAAAMTASGSAADTLAHDPVTGDAALLEVASAKIRCGEAAHQGAMIAHQAHGAIGWTQDYTLQMFTRALWGWRDDFGSETWWATRLGEHIAHEGADQIWPLLTTR